MFIVNILLSLLMLCFIICIHEVGHMLCAKLVGVKTDEFSIGMGYQLYSKTIKDTKYAIRLFPVGGFVNLNEKQMENIAPLKKSLILVGGVLFNILTALVFSWVYIALATDYSLIKVLISGPVFLVGAVKLFVIAIMGIFATADTSALGGPISVVSEVSKTISTDGLTTIWYIILISINLAVFNLIPIPPLDGGQLVLTWLRVLVKDKAKKFEVAFSYLGVFLIIGLTVFAFKNDICNLWFK